MKKLHPRLLAVAVLLALAACRPGAAEYTEAEAPKNLTLDNASAHVSLRFAPGSSRLVAGDAARLRALAASGGISSSDRVSVAAAGSPALATARFQTISAELLRYGVVASQRQLAAIPPNQAVIDSGRYLVTLPPCPNWSKSSATDFTNTSASNFGCATAVNLGMSVAYPADLVEGRPIMSTEGTPAAAAVNRYLTDKVQLPTAAAVGPIAAQSAGTPPSAGAAAGSQP
jgi:pilus assembly protein CpaD